MDNIVKFFFPMQPLASVEGRDIDVLMYLIHGLILILFIGWAVYFVVVLFKFRQSKNPVARNDTNASAVSAAVEWGVAAVEFLLLFAFSIPFWAVHMATIPLPGKNTVEVKVLAQQFAWLVHYAGPDGQYGHVSAKLLQENPFGLDSADPAAKDDITTMNQIYLPIGKTAIIRMSSKDVIHSFGLPAMRVKQDIIPGLQTSVSFTPTQLGQFEIVCSQLCGLGHYQMRGIVNVLSQAEYDQWIRDEKGNHD
jgi:cytochrome c oxidase subunit 2